LVVDTLQAEDNADVSSLRQERVVVDKSPQREQAIHAAGVLVVAEDSADSQHERTSTSNRVCLIASYRDRNRAEERRIRSICGSCRVAHNAKTYNAANINSPARNE